MVRKGNFKTFDRAILSSVYPTLAYVLLMVLCDHRLLGGVVINSHMFKRMFSIPYFSLY